MSNAPRPLGRQDLIKSLTAGRNPALLIASLMTRAPMSTTFTPFRAPPKLPTAVLAPLTMTTSFIFSHPFPTDRLSFMSYCETFHEFNIPRHLVGGQVLPAMPDQFFPLHVY